MKNGKLKRMTHRALSMLLAVLTVLPSGLLTMPARAAEIQTTQTKLVVWDWITDMQSIGKGADYDPNTDPFVDGHAAIPVKDTKYTRIMFYQSTGGDRYYFNGDGATVKRGDEDKLYMDEYSRVGHSSHKEWNQDLADFEHFITVGGERTPYIKWRQVKEGYQEWRLYMADKNTDAYTNWALCLADDFEDLYTIYDNGSGYGEWGGKDTRIDGWIIDKHFVGAAAANYEYTHDNFVLWHWDNDRGGYNETMDFDVSGRRFKAFNAGTKAGVEEFKIYLGKEYSVGTLAENYTVPSDQSQTLGRPLYYIPKGKVLTVAKDAVLTIDGVLLNDGEIVVKDGGLLVVKDGAKIMPLTKYDNNCGMITSQGNIVVGDNALLCGGGVNGIRILGGGVVNFGVMAAESFYVSENYAIDNRETGWVLAGKSPSRESRIRYITDAIANEGATRPTDVNKDFAKIANFDSSYNIPVNGIYGNTAGVSKSGEKAVGSASDPTLSVYTRDTPNDAYEKVFEDVKLDKVDVRVEGDKAIYTAEGETYTIQKKLVAAAIGRGDKDRETIFTDMWVGALDGAYVQLEPIRATGMRLGLSGGSANNSTAVVVRKADSDMDKWWHITKAGTVGVNQTYYIDSVKSKSEARGLDMPGVNSVSNGASVYLYKHDDGGNDQRWVLMHSSGTQYFLRNAANQNVSLAVTDAAVKDGAAVRVQTNSSYEIGQYWNLVNLLTEDSYASAVTLGTAMEFIPQSATGMRMALSSGAAAGQGVTIRTSDAANNAQRWRLEPVGTDNMDGVATTFYRVMEMTSGLALSVQGTEIREGVSLIAANIAAGSGGNTQYWYLTGAGGADKYYIAARGNTGLVVSAPNSQSPASGSGLTLKANAKGDYQQWEIAGADDAIAAAEATETSDDPFAGRVFELQPANFPSSQKPAELRVANLGDGNVEIKRNHSDRAALQWVFQKIGDDTVDGETRPYYQILPAAEKTRALAPEGGTANNDTSIIADAASMNNSAQHWYVTENSDGSYTITPRSNADVALGEKLIGWGWQTAISSRTDQSRTYARLTWKLIPEMYDPLNGKSFVLEPKHALGMAAGVKDSSDANYANVELQASKTTAYQMWTFEKAGAEELHGVMTPYYQIKNKASGMVLSTPYRSYVSSGQSLEQYTAENAVHQHWFAVLGDDGYYTLVSRLNSRVCLDVKGGGTTAGSDIQAYNKNDTDSQKWKLAAPTVTDFIDGRVFYLSPKHTGTSKVLDLVGNGSGNGTQVQLYDKKETEIQRWKFERLGVDYLNGVKCNYYAIHSVYSPTRALDIPGGSTSNGTRPQLYDYSASNKNQQWYVTDAGGGYYYIIPRSDTTKYLGVAGSSTSNNAAVELWDSNGDNRKWKLTETIVPETLGTYSILPKHAPGMHVGPASSNSDNGTKLIIWEYNESSNYARWTFVKMGTDSGGAYYKIVNMANSKVIDATGNNTIQADSQLQQWDSDFNNDQLWYLNDAGQDENGLQYYNIVNRCDTNYCMSVSGGSTTHGTGVTVSKKNGGDSQKFRLMERFEPVELGTYEFGNPTAVSMRLTVAGGSSSDGANIILYKKHTTNAGGKLQLFKIIQRGNDLIDGVKTPYYSIENLNGGKVLDPPGAADVSDGANVQQYTYDGYSDQHWYMEIRGDNTVVFRNRANSKLVLETAGTTDNSNVRLGTYSDSNLNQRWQLHPVMETSDKGQYYIPGSQAAADAGIPFMSAEDTLLNPEVGGKYNLIPQHSSTLRMDLYGGSTGNGTKIQAYTNNGSDAQKWQFIPMGVDYFDGVGRIYYKLAYGSNANKVVQSANYWGPITAAENLEIYDDEGCYDDQWYLEQAGERTDEDGETFYNYYIVGRGTLSKADKICIGVPGGAGSGTQLQTATVRSGSSYKYLRWEVLPTD